MTVAKKTPSLNLIDQLLAGYQKPEDLIGEHGLLKQLTKAVVERALQAEMAAHLGHGKHESGANTHAQFSAMARLSKSCLWRRDCHGR